MLRVAISISIFIISLLIPGLKAQSQNTLNRTDSIREVTRMIRESERKKADSIKQNNRLRLDSIRQAKQIRKKSDSLALIEKKEKLQQVRLAKVLSRIEQAYEKGIQYEPNKEEKKILQPYQKRINDSISDVKKREKTIESLAKEREKDSLNKIESAEKLKLKAFRDSIALEKKMIAKLKKQEKDSLSKIVSEEKLRLKGIKDSIEVQQKITLRQQKQANDSLKKLAKEQNKLKTDSLRRNENETVIDTQIISLAKVDTIIVLPNDSFSRNKSYTLRKRKTFLSFQLGSSNYLGDLGGQSNFVKNNLIAMHIKPRTFFYGIAYTYHPSNLFGFRLNYIAGKIAGSDQNIHFANEKDPAYLRFSRNLDFQTKISEISLLVDFYPFDLFSGKRSDKLWSRRKTASLQPYLVGGIGNFSFDPEGSYYDPIAEENIWVKLSPLQLEGQGMSEYPDRKPYKLSQWNLPFGFGLRYQVGQKTSISLEYIGRKLFTDYLDDVSTHYINPILFDKYLDAENAVIAKYVADKSKLINPDKQFSTGDIRGNSKSNDFYYSFNIKLNIQINKVRIYK